ncbi:uncharacterized protein LOC126905282 [Daktulosphaira vitifoliae]|uniref:uncharacterized protein LOC126905282 n=1 Tax=Daktulosphaira vitifoliae TaxID=58002 RepID=UPI0021A99BA4|nr:uncharacterized protein LOC126905282 [Daktulosphaira vitifoliae]
MFISINIIITFCVFYCNTLQLNYESTVNYIQLTPCQSSFKIGIGKYNFDYDALITENYYRECTFLIESPAKSQMHMNATISIPNLDSSNFCTYSVKMFDVQSISSPTLLGEYCESTNITDLTTYSNIIYILIKISSKGLFQLDIDTA